MSELTLPSNNFESVGEQRMWGWRVGCGRLWEPQEDQGRDSWGQKEPKWDLWISARPVCGQRVATWRKVFQGRPSSLGICDINLVLPGQEKNLGSGGWDLQGNHRKSRWACRVARDANGCDPLAGPRQQTQLRPDWRSTSLKSFSRFFQSCVPAEH